MFYIRHLFMFSTKFNLNILLQHIPGYRNKLADLLSRQQVPTFLQLQPHMLNSILHQSIHRSGSSHPKYEQSVPTLSQRRPGKFIGLLLTVTIAFVNKVDYLLCL